ncbi:hypothetical protein COCC4DRAFT_54723 [Bipolaris maydis ATCC 48331]|uniref:RNA polymerase II assembly factor Rtp1 C-terminal domain-containing protein n=2 Tax=Cochliobolus heterostrophus TaxID=5016 RepID=M2UAH4_COCH5|nr:uncharacterized protein COCC4DRAFT_54723 [Bipolaris maydis ATCC 48331]EMD84983.1 hypothetical protein COCHEDRAFT_1149648 [Bipolaris maydis C5]KAJ5058677.1 hypothetical protein J3E74DRAFT_419335 [Bipolaris maydis]ENH98943.1 hypothetical protein COCC4DRAFT_54723 [Bipolaris maydis ATCC 48331]KAJ6208654.1 hypothetical protein PSV09DRAFT_1149648 [Bipolaris maydis]KAJ6270564.1 hypothetical protein PSV08DRAFT_362121 [Bipolaris maydis]
MGVIEDAVDSAANFIGPFVDKGRKFSSDVPSSSLIQQSLRHLQAINAADLVADPNAPYDASLAGVVYGLLDLIIILAVIPQLSPGVAFSQRPRSVLTSIVTASPDHDMNALAVVIEGIIPILEQKGSGIQPLLSQRILPDVVSALAELSFSPFSPEDTKSKFSPIYKKMMIEIPTSRLLPMLTSFLQQPLPEWLKPIISMELSMIPLRQQGVRHTIEFLALSYLSKNSHIPEGASGPPSQIPIPLEAITQASKLLVLPPSGITSNDWIERLAPQLLHLLHGCEGKELSRAAGQIIAGGILSKKTTGAPGTIGWKIFVEPVFHAISPKHTQISVSEDGRRTDIVVREGDLKPALRQLNNITSSYSHAGLIKRLVTPMLLPLWALLNYAKRRPSLDKEWAELPKSIISRYVETACDAKQIDNMTRQIFWDGGTTWTFGPGSEGGVEIRWRTEGLFENKTAGMEGILEQIGDLDNRVNLLVSLLSEASVPGDVASSVFLSTTKRWLEPMKPAVKSLTDEDFIGDPLSALVDAKLSESLARQFQEHFARSPQHIVELMTQLIKSFVEDHKKSLSSASKSLLSQRAMLGNIVQKQATTGEKNEEDAVNEDLVSFALSILNTMVASPDFQKTPLVNEMLLALLPSLAYLSECRNQTQSTISSMISNSSTSLFQLIAPTTANSPSTRTGLPTSVPVDPLAEHRAALSTCLEELQSTDPPNRTWALNTIRSMLNNPVAFPVIDIPSLTHILLSSSLADAESYVHLAAIPVLVTLAARVPKPVVGILVDAFVDVDERSLKLARGKHTEEKERELRNALDLRLRVGEVLNTFAGSNASWNSYAKDGTMYRHAKQITEACLLLSGRRGQRMQTLSMRNEVADSERKLKEEGEVAWGGPIPNVFEPDGADPQEQADYTALHKIVSGWENTGIEEDIRMRTSALSVLSTLLEHRLEVLQQPLIDASLQMALLILGMEKGDAKALLRRAGVLVIMGLLRGIDAAMGAGKEDVVALNLKQQQEIERVIRWVKDEDTDELVRDHASSVVEGLETLRMKELHRMREQGLNLDGNLGLEGNLRGLEIQPGESKKKGQRMMVEEIE